MVPVCFSGSKNEIEKIDHLLDYNYLSEHILLPTIRYSRERKFINEVEAKILAACVGEQVLSAGQLKAVFPKKKPSEISRQIRRLIEKKMLQPTGKNKRKYVLRFGNNYLLRGVVEQLKGLGFCQ